MDDLYEMNASFDERSALFLEWFKSLPGATFHPHIMIEDYRPRGAGRGIVANADIPEDTTLFTIPRSAIINAQTSELPKKIPDVFATTGLEDVDNEADEDGSETSGPPDNWVSLILIMIYEYLQGDKSKWKPYFDVLPTEFETLIWWSEQELQQLQASSIASKIGKEEADNMFRAKVLPVIAEHPDIFYPEGSRQLGEDALMNLAHRMGSTIMAYAFDLENDDEDADADNEDDWIEDKEGQLMMGMVPMADILNADASFNAHINHGDDSLTATSLRPLKTGEEVLNYYGPLGNGDLLRRYGYVTDTHARYDVVEISWDAVMSVLKDMLNLDETTWGKAVNELDLEEIEDAFVIDRDSGEPSSRGEVEDDVVFKQLPADLEDQVHTLLKAVRKHNPESIPNKTKRDEITLSAIRRVLELRLAQYPTSVVDDFNSLAEMPKSGRLSKAVFVRMGEKSLLREAIEFVRSKLDQLDLAALHGRIEPSAKRQKR
ncbi:SET domain-containing protein [Xylariomycetidae sp. FL2044]|nr:SET domain-containing protein [Xylariomycetidae sp. FL2044]